MSPVGSKSGADSQKEAQLRLKKFEMMAKKSGVSLRDLESLIKKEPDKDNQKKMKATFSKLEKTLAAKNKGKAPSGKLAMVPPPGGAGGKVDEEKEAKLRLKKFEVMAKQNPPDLKALEKMAKLESHHKAKSEMVSALKKLNAKAKNTSPSGPPKPGGMTVPATPGGGSAKLTEHADAQKRLKQFLVESKKGKVDLAKLERLARMEKDPQVQRQMLKELQVVKKKAGR